MTPEWQVRTGSAADLDLVGPLWVAVHHQHAQTMPQLAPYVSDDESWHVRRVLYEELLAKTDTLLLLAFVGNAAVGYGLAHVLPVDETWVPDTWSSGWGSELLNRLEQHLDAIGVKDLILGAIPGNTDAIRLYERRGYKPTWLYLSRFEGR
jgi:GNAT superfamily N-acetyltransferase